MGPLFEKTLQVDLMVPTILSFVWVSFIPGAESSADPLRPRGQEAADRGNVSLCVWSHLPQCRLLWAATWTWLRQGPEEGEEPADRPTSPVAFVPRRGTTAALVRVCVKPREAEQPEVRGAHRVSFTVWGVHLVRPGCQLSRCLPLVSVQWLLWRRQGVGRMPRLPVVVPAVWGLHTRRTWRRSWTVTVLRTFSTSTHGPAHTVVLQAAWSSRWRPPKRPQQLVCWQLCSNTDILP